MRLGIHPLLIIVTLLAASLRPAMAQAPPPAAPQAPASKAADAMELVKQGQKLVADGKIEEAVALYQRALQEAPDLYDAHLYLGVAYDLQAKYPEAHQQLLKAIELASEAQTIQALRVTAVSYAFECNMDKASEYERRAFDLQYNWKKYADAANTADELARIYLECGDYDNAFQWYQTGHLTALKNPDITPAEKDLWEFRWEAALARIAARKAESGKPPGEKALAAQAQQHLAAGKAILEKNDNPDQMRFYPYLAGYVALYTGDYKGAIAELQKADQKDVFVLCLLAEAYEKSGDKAQAKDYYKKVLAVNVHNPTNAFARPLAEKKVAANN
jgi:tetratricopeptide (TPR) repeat protein